MLELDSARKLAAKLLASSQFSDAELILLDLLRAHPSDAGLLRGLEKVYSARGDFQRVIEVEKKLITAFPEDPYLYNNLGVSLMKVEELGPALAAYSKAIQLFPNFAGAYNNLGNCF